MTIEMDEDFETILLCAERYACGRQSYMPSIVVGYITAKIPVLSDAMLALLVKDMEFAERTGGFGDEYIDKPLWMQLWANLRAEIDKRKDVR